MDRREFLRASALMVAAGSFGIGPAHRDGLDAVEWTAMRRFAKTAFGAIAYVERGAGQVALFLHGFPLNGFQWRGAIPRLSPYRRCIAPDFLGLGHTQVAEGQGVAPDAQVAMLVSLLDTLGIDAVDLIANDSGGAVAQLLMVRHPERVRSLLLTNCDAEPDSPPPALLPVIALAKEGTFVDRWLAPWHADTRLARSPEGLGGMCYADPLHPTDEAIAMYLGPLVASPRRKALVHQYALGLDPNPLAGIAAKLARSRIPVRILWGTADTIFSPDSPRYLDRTFGRSRGVRRIAGGKLFWPEERPGIIAEEALRLWT